MNQARHHTVKEKKKKKLKSHPISNGEPKAHQKTISCGRKFLRMGFSVGGGDKGGQARKGEFFFPKFQILFKVGEMYGSRK